MDGERGDLGIVGAGAWGTGLALVAAQAGRRVRLWTRDPGLAQALEHGRENLRHLPGVRLPAEVRVTAELADLEPIATLLIAVPAQAVRAILRALPNGRRTILICAKGLERPSGLRLSQVAAEVRPDCRVAVLSGPSFAQEVAHSRPTAVTLAAADQALAQRLAAVLAGPTFRPYPSDDVPGVEIGGALKNVVAIAAGVVMGRGLGENARAALVTRGLAELARLGRAEGAQPETLMGLSGLGDLLLTATSLTSRNTRFGYELARGASAGDLMAQGRALSEGAFTAEAACARAAHHGIELPIAEAVRAVIAGEQAIDAAIEALLARPLPAME